MDAILPALISALPQLGGAGVILFILVLVLRSAASDRVDYRAELAAAAQRHTDEIKRINSDHDAEIADLRAEVKELRKQLADQSASTRAQLMELERELDTEREQRRKAEDVAAEARRRRPA